MAVTRTFSIIKPDATRRNLTGAVTKMLEDAGLRVIASKRIRMTRDQAEGFYAVHKERPFYNDLCTFMTSGPVVVQVLEGEDAVKLNRDVMGATNPADAAEGTIRKLYAESIEANSVHGSDSDENAAIEIAFFFNDGRNRRLNSADLIDWKAVGAIRRPFFLSLRASLKVTRVMELSAKCRSLADPRILSCNDEKELAEPLTFASL